MRRSMAPRGPLPKDLAASYTVLRPDLTLWQVRNEIGSLRMSLSYVMELGHSIPARRYARMLASIGLAVLAGHSGSGR